MYDYKICSDCELDSQKNLKIIYELTEDLHYVDDYGILTEYGIKCYIEGRSESVNSCVCETAPHISPDKNFVLSLMNCLAKNQVFPVHAYDIICEMIG